MEPEFWHERWRSGEIGFHQSTVDRNLRRHWPSLALPKGSRVFVPLCGKSLDLLWLRDAGHSVVGVEISAVAVEAFFAENGISARRRVQGDFDILEAANLTLFRGDFFALTPALLGDVAALYDRAALVSWKGEQRPRYVEHVATLTSSAAQILLISLEYPQAQMSGPPFCVDGAEVRRLYSPLFRIEEIARGDILAYEPRFRARGLKELFEVCYHLVRL
ncbi:MAG TPA: thiopurine S-methyltransferase [Steroidobacteraceae bacterium]|nr:thiopurine S-methyltransferase [Steroidobacteraceae bacterium]